LALNLDSLGPDTLAGCDYTSLNFAASAR
jgi:hypothetical protein